MIRGKRVTAGIWATVAIGLARTSIYGDVVTHYFANLWHAKDGCVIKRDTR